MGLKELLDDTKDEAIKQAKKAIMKSLKPLLIKGLCIILAVILVASSTIAIFDALGDVISGIITGTINAINSIAGKFSRWLINTGIQDDSNNYWIRLDEPYSQSSDEIEINYESSNTSVKLDTGVTINIQNGDITEFNKDNTLGISFISIYGLDKDYKKTTVDSDTTFVVGYGKEGVAVFGSNGTVKAYNKDIKDIEFSKIAITDVGIVLANEDKSKMVTFDFNMNITSRDVKGRTLPDLYLEHLYSTGLSLDNLRVLVGRVDEKLSVDEILADEEQKEKAEKYIKEFLRADLISSSTHKTDCKKNIDPNDDKSNRIDGGIYIWRTSDDVYSWDEEISASQAEETKNVKTKKMRFIPYDAFHKTFEADMDNGQLELDFIALKGWKEVYTITEDGNLELFVFDITYDSDEDILPSEIFGRAVGTHARIATIDYKEYIKQYTMPFEFLMATAYTCENPEYAYHLAFLARETMVDLVICDEYEVEYEKTSLKGKIVEVDREKQKYTLTSDGYNSEYKPVGDAIPVNPRTKTIEENADLGSRTTLNLKGNVNAFVVRANAWDSYLMAELWRKSTKPEKNTNTPVTGIEENHGTRTFKNEGNEEIEDDPNSYWNTHGWLQEVITEKTGTTTSYKVEYEIREPYPNSRGYKYKAFYGLLRAKDESEAEDKCKTEADVINHIKTIDTDEQGYNMNYMLQQIGINDPPINILANEREVLYRQIETFGKAFNKDSVETGEKDHTTETPVGDVVIIKPDTENGSNGTNYDWLYAYLDSAFADFHLGKFQQLENLPDGFDDFFGEWTVTSGERGYGDNDLIDSKTGEHVTVDDGKEYVNRFGQKAIGYVQRIWGQKALGDRFWHGGCGQCCVASIISMFKGKDRGNPAHVWNDLAKHTWAGLGWMLELEGIPSHEVKHPSNPVELIKNNLKDGKPVIIHLAFSYGGKYHKSHFVLAMGISEDNNEMLLIDSGLFWKNGYKNISEFLSGKEVLDLRLVDKAPPAVEKPNNNTNQTEEEI